MTWALGGILLRPSVLRFLFGEGLFDCVYPIAFDFEHVGFWSWLSSP
jgi:hypothetical protein